MDKDILEKLKKKIPYQWKVQTVHGDKATCVAYIDARDAMDLLDEAVGADNWQCDYKEVSGNVYCGVAIRVATGDWVWKWDAGAESAYDKEKGEASDAFKRACVRWGIGRFLYNLDVKWVKMSTVNGKSHPVDDNGNRIYDLTKHFSVPTAPVASKENKTATETVTDMFTDPTKESILAKIFKAQKANGTTDEEVKQIITNVFVGKTRYAELSIEDAQALLKMVQNNKKKEG